nr:putative zinc finger, CCHC-type, retrotransposon Gag domain protein [Tanacetum cinerariifolium]
AITPLDEEVMAVLRRRVKTGPLFGKQIVMANPNPEDPNVPNEDVSEEDPYHLLDYDEEKDPEMDIKEDEHEEDLVDNNDDVEEEDDENEDVDIKEDEDAEIIFPYEVQGDQTSPPRDESSDSEFEAEEADDELDVEETVIEPEAEGADVELEAEEPDGAPEATIGTGSQRPFAIRNFPMGFHEAGESSTARDPQFLETSRTEIALLGSKAKIRKIEREILHHDLSGVEETLEKVVERLKVLESEENATLKKKLAEKENERFYLEMVRKGVVPKPPSDDEGSERPRKTSKKSNGDEGPSDPRGPLMAGGSGGASGSGRAGGSGGTGRNADGTGVRGAGPTVPELTGCTYATFIKCDPLPFNETEGAVGLYQWFEKLESVFQISECKEKDRVKFVMATLRGRALTWWNGRTKAMGIEDANNTPWSENGGTRGSKSGTIPSGLTKSIRGDVTSSQPTTINDAVCLAYQLVGQLIQDKADEATEDEKRKGEGDRGSRGDNRHEHNRRQN